MAYYRDIQRQQEHQERALREAEHAGIDSQLDKLKAERETEKPRRERIEVIPTK